MKAIQPNTQAGRLLRVLADGRWHGGPDEFGNDFHTARNRINAELAEAGFATASRRREGKPWYEYRLTSAAGTSLACSAVARWDVGFMAGARGVMPNSAMLVLHGVEAADGS